jgi:peptidoglycan hydrolase-like protein with peptidoglycan-binding domain
MLKKLCMSLIVIFILLTFLSAVSLAQQIKAADKETILKAQRELKLLGYYKGKITGEMDQETRAAIRSFQKDEKDIKVPTGILDDNTSKKISKKVKDKINIPKLK